MGCIIGYCYCTGCRNLLKPLLLVAIGYLSLFEVCFIGGSVLVIRIYFRCQWTILIIVGYWNLSEMLLVVLLLIVVDYRNSSYVTLIIVIEKYNWIVVSENLVN